ncbi:MAG: hypothetical protein IPG74_09920 [Flavobacteriales bacterium]|nr:hypothetical protein [Flavobacteriales bacterium]
MVAGSANVDGNGSSFAMARYFGNGSLDTLFSDDGIVATPVGATSTCTALTIQSDGKVLLAGVAGVAPSGNFRVDRYMNDLEVGTVETDPRAMVWVAYPNPFINEAVLEFELASSETIACDLLDSQGRWIRTVFSNAILSRGRHREVLDLSSIAPGCYSLLLRSSEGNYGVRIVKQ